MTYIILGTKQLIVIYVYIEVILLIFHMTENCTREL